MTDVNNTEGLVVYGVSGVMEWNALIRIGDGTVSVPFRYGSYTGLGTQCAEFRTTNAFYQEIIERSPYFLDGKIFIITDYREERPEAEDSAEPHQGESEDETERAEPQTGEPVEVASLEDAKAYLVEHFGFKPQGLKSKRSILLGAEANGIKFVCPELD